MNLRRLPKFVFSFFAFTLILAARGVEAPVKPIVDESLYSGMKWRFVGTLRRGGATGGGGGGGGAPIFFFCSGAGGGLWKNHNDPTHGHRSLHTQRLVGVAA